MLSTGSHCLDLGRWFTLKRSFVSLAGPLAIVAIGLFFLLSTLGVVPWAVWDELARCWPALVFLVGLGILVQNLPGRSKG